MSKIIPFKAVRPTRDKVSLVAARPYQSYTKEEREARMNYNPFSFLHIINPGYKYDKEVSGKARYSLVKNRYLEFKEDGVFIQDLNPSYYVYKIIDRDQQEYHGIIAAASAEDYENDVIKKHEQTISSRELVFKNYLDTVGFNAEPVLIMHADNKTLEHIIDNIIQGRAEYEFTTTYKDTHLLWKIEDTTNIDAISKVFDSMPSIYIADGHHRSMSSYLLYKDKKRIDKPQATSESYNYFMCYLIPESQIRIYEFNRLIKDLNGHSKEEFLIKLDTVFRIENRGEKPYKPSKKHHFSMYLDGAFYSLYLRKTTYQKKSSLDDLDAQILYKLVLQPLLNIQDLRKDNRIDYSNGKDDIVSLKSRVDSGEFTVGFGMCPASISQMKQIADDGLKMPPKSTYIEPKLRSGITIYEY